MSSWDVAAATPTKALRAPLLDASDHDLGPATPTQPAPATAGSMDDLATKLSRFRLSVRGLQTMVARGASAASLEAAVDSAALESAAILAEFSRGLAPDAARADRGKRNKLRRDFQVGRRSALRVRARVPPNTPHPSPRPAPPCPPRKRMPRSASSAEP